MQRYFSSSLKDVFELNKDDSYHIIKVMRLAIHDKIETVINGVLYISEIISIDNDIVTVKRKEKIIEEHNLCKVVIAQSLVKEQKMDLIIQKATELGVDEIIPINTRRSIVKLDKKESKKIERWQKIAKEASEQSKRLTIPRINSILDLSDLCKMDFTHKLLCSVNEHTETIKSVLQNLKKDDTIIIVVGPEGGFDHCEENLLINNGFISVSLGNNVLRTETAPLFVMSVINYILMR